MVKSFDTACSQASNQPKKQSPKPIEKTSKPEKPIEKTLKTALTRDGPKWSLSKLAMN